MIPLSACNSGSSLQNKPSCSFVHLYIDLRAAFQYLRGAYKKAKEGLLTRACSDETRGNGFKLKEGRCRLHLDLD